MATRAEKNTDPKVAWEEAIRVQCRELARHMPEFWARMSRYSINRLAAEARKLRKHVKVDHGPIKKRYDVHDFRHTVPINLDDPASY